MNAISGLLRKLPAKFWAVWNILCILLCLLLIYAFAGGPVFSIRQAFRRAEKANFVGPSKILAVEQMEDMDYDRLVLADAGEGVILYAYDGIGSENTEFIYLKKSGEMTVAVAPGDDLLWYSTQVSLPVFLFVNNPRAVRAEMDLTLHGQYMGESFEKTYYLESQRENQGYFRFSLRARRGGSLGAEGYALYTLRNITGYSMADTSDVAFPATIRLYDGIGKMIQEENIVIFSAAVNARISAN